MQNLKVRLFGNFSMTYGDAPVLFKRNSGTKAMQLLQMLLYYGDQGIARVKLLDNLYGQEELADTANNLRVTVYRLKKMLAAMGLPDGDYIRISKGVYYWNSPMETIVDVHEFEKLIAASEQDEDERDCMHHLREACELYVGELLPGIFGEEWVLIEGVELKDKYTDALKQVCDYYMGLRQYEDVLKLTQTASDIYPFDEWQSTSIDCYIALNRYKEAFKLYEDTAKLFFEELGISPSDKMLGQFESMSNRMSYNYQNISDIKKGLQEDKADNGAYYSSLPSFRDNYRLINRIIERSGQSVFLMICSLTDGQGHPLENPERLNSMSQILFCSIQHCLRRGDLFTKYSPSQYLILLLGTNQEDCDIVYNRIVEYFSSKHKSWAQYLTKHVSSIADANDDL